MDNPFRFHDKKNRNSICLECSRRCNQSMAVELIYCPEYKPRKKFIKINKIRFPKKEKGEEICIRCHEIFIYSNNSNYTLENFFCNNCIKEILETEREEKHKKRSEKMSLNLKKMWKKDEFIYSFFKGVLFGKDFPESELTKLDKEIIRTRIRLFKIQQKEVINDD